MCMQLGWGTVISAWAALHQCSAGVLQPAETPVSRLAGACSVLFKEVAVLGSGNFSRVYRVVGRVDGCEYAIKRSTRPLLCEDSRRQWVQVLPCRHSTASAAPCVLFC